MTSQSPRRRGARAAVTAAAAAILCVWLVALTPATSDAASLAGRVTNASGGGLSQMRVTAWVEDEVTKTWIIIASDTTDSSGAWAITSLSSGSYRLHARMAPGRDGNFADRWYDVAEPTADGYIGADADVIEVAASDDVTGLDFSLPVVGGLDGRIVSGGSPLTGMQVRVERAGEPRLHHNDWSDPCCVGDHHGRFYMRGLPPANDYRVLVHDPSGLRGTLIRPGPYTVSSGSNSVVGDIGLAPLSTDPNEPNDSSDAAGAPLDVGALRIEPPAPVSTSGAFIGPRGSDVDWYCFDSIDGDRLLMTVTATIETGGVTRESPWVDPMLGIFDGTGELLFFDDDSGPGARESFIDTGVLRGDGELCAVVTMFGDTEWSGASQGSAGEYELQIEMGNREPSLDVSVIVDGEVLTDAGPTVGVEEGQLMLVEMRFADPDGDPLGVELEHRDAAGEVVDLPTLVVGTGSAVYTWNVSETAGENSPFVIDCGVTDGELSSEVSLTVEVLGVNRAPSTPELLRPLDGATLRESDPDLALANSVDADGDPLQYEFEVIYGADQGEPDQFATLSEGDNGETVFPTSPIPDNTVVSWRARAYDGQAESAYSPWTEPFTFLVDAENSPPSTPVLLKPDNGEELLERWPTLSARNSTDPEGDAIMLTFEVAIDAEFRDTVTRSDPVLQSRLGSTTNWAMDVPLDWGGTYYARVSAVDDYGAASEISNVNVFRVRANTVAGAPSLGEPFASQCDGYAFGQEPPSEVRVANVSDPEGEAITFELEIHDAEADPATATPLVAVAVPQDEEAGFTLIAFDSSAIEAPGHYLIRVRAFDGTDHTEWAACDFYVAEPPPDPSPIEIVAPEEGTLFPRDTTEVVAEVRNAFEPGLTAQEGLVMAYCLSPDPNFGHCAANAAEWDSVPQSSLDPAETTEIVLTGFEAGQNWWLRVCARRADGNCGSTDETQFSIQQPEKLVTPGCTCDVVSSRGLAGVGTGLWLLALAALAVSRRTR